ncbi:MAG: winged helix-turn-helix transcriptional regulator [Thaumarchaeota archaeon]|nr:winged helix-turn-helix transcriptional regulator [Nitrososphaerota archaeon]MBI3641579.1 winged helix-turn-helix transcriptional regulator [Nitrososphaerota archaeon]
MGSPWKAIADDSRREILLLLRKRQMTPDQLAEHFQFTPPALSTHLRILREADLITEKKLGKNRYYSLDEAKSLEIINFFEKIWGGDTT